MNYDDKTDPQLAKLVGESLGYECEIDDNYCWVIKRPEVSTATHPQLQDIGTVSQNRGRTLAVVFDPCNNPSDAWPIIVDHSISIMQIEGEQEWIAFFWGDDFECSHANPLRAAMIVYLMMQEGTND
jgi:hypothetical protein